MYRYDVGVLADRLCVFVSTCMPGIVFVIEVTSEDGVLKRSLTEIAHDDEDAPPAKKSSSSTPTKEPPVDPVVNLDDKDKDLVGIRLCKCTVFVKQATKHTLVFRYVVERLLYYTI